ncbi:Photosystem I assembly protein Ycf3 [Polaribacter huanghezhanensis]|uniref:tetratricopeptide repeat protein n=1 Tax=Polaribacter huanghezhanensis TaxID=1354726 RepID=UPI0026477583|nr:tetratricopeptide repeat protein [Polaribacter huanghezhanensis]WKD85276.1 Photosystem I assembly protein Ycf3 [Polaribacter huanghezhanensis]
MKKLFFFLCMLSSTIFVAQTSTKMLFDNANLLYKDGKFEEAIKIYQEIEAKDSVSSTLYYNLGNSYYKLNKVAHAIYNYEKALMLNPLNKDAATNLGFARRMTIDNIEELPKTFLQRLEINYLQKFTYNQWAMFTIVFSFLAAILFLLFYFSTISNKKRIYFLTSMLSFFLLIISVFITYHQYQKALNTKYAIIFSPKTTVNNAPILNSDEIFELHEGTKVRVLDAVDNWKKIKLSDGKIGWISADNLKMLTDK